MATPTEPAFPQAAYDLLVDRVHKPVFLEKLARDYNVVPANPQEEYQLLELAGQLRLAKEGEAQKQAAAGNSFIAEASDSLKAAMSQFGYAAQPTSRERQVRHYAAGLAKEAAVRDAALTFGGYLNQLQGAA